MYEQRNTTGKHPTTIEDIQQPGQQYGSEYRGMNQPRQDQQYNSGHHPTTVDDLQPQYGNLNTKREGLMNTSNVSSTPSEYGSDDSSHRSPHLGSNTTSHQRPVADKNAFIRDEDTKQYVQHNTDPVERAKELADEMEQDGLNKRRGNSDDKLLRLGGKREYKLD